MTLTDQQTARMMILASSAIKVARTDAERGLVQEVVNNALQTEVEPVHLRFFETVIDNWSKTTT